MSTEQVYSNKYATDEDVKKISNKLILELNGLTRNQIITILSRIKTTIDYSVPITIQVSTS